MAECKHPKNSRVLLGGYDISCGDCHTILGRVALFPCAVLDTREAHEVMEHLDVDLTTEGPVVFRGALQKLWQAARTAREQEKATRG